MSNMITVKQAKEVMPIVDTSAVKTKVYQFTFDTDNIELPEGCVGIIAPAVIVGATIIAPTISLQQRKFTILVIDTIGRDWNAPLEREYALGFIDAVKINTAS